MKWLQYITVMALLVGCSPPQEVSYYPDCFAGMDANVKNYGGCGGVFVYAYLGSNRLVSIQLNEESLDLNTTCQEFKIGEHPEAIEVTFFTFGNHPDSTYFNHCTDALSPPESLGKSIKFTAISGSVIAAVSRSAAYREVCESYRASVRLDSVYFREEVAGKRSPSPRDTLINWLIIRDVEVGYCIP